MNETRHTPGPWRVSNHVRTIDGRQVECDPDLGMFDACIMTTNSEGRLLAIAGERGSKLNPYDYLPVTESTANMRLIAAAPGLLAACEVLWSELKGKVASIDVHPGFPFDDASPCTVYFLDRIVHCGTMTEGIAKCEELMAEEFPDVYAAIAAAKGPPQ